MQKSSVITQFCSVYKQQYKEELYLLVEIVTKYDKTVMIYGKLGTGKDLVARTINELSHPAGSPFIPVSCFVLNSSLLENDLFGHVKRKFTGAIKGR